jgi:hypothetical protein
MSRHFSGVFGKHGNLVHIALFQANAVTVFKINGRYEQHGSSKEKEVVG